MKAAVLVAPASVQVTEVAAPRIEAAGDAIVAVNMTAVCGTDLHAYRGHVPTVPPGTVMGHEFVGTVHETGHGVTRFQPGDPVIGADFVACGRCWWCRRGSHWHCPERQVFGYGSTFGPPLGGAQAELVRVPHADHVLYHRPSGVSEAAAVFMTDTLATGLTAADRGGVSSGDIVAVVGGGTVGQMVSLACQAAGAAAVVVVDLVSPRRDLARSLGAVPSGPEEARSIVSDLTAGRGADVVVEAVGGGPPLRAAIELVRPAGRVISVGAHFDPAWEVPLDRFFESELRLEFALGDPYAKRDPAVPLVSSGIIDPTQVVTEQVGFDEIGDAYERLSTGQAVKPLVVVRS